MRVDLCSEARARAHARLQLTIEARDDELCEVIEVNQTKRLYLKRTNKTASRLERSSITSVLLDFWEAKASWGPTNGTNCTVNGNGKIETGMIKNNRHRHRAILADASKNEIFSGRWSRLSKKMHMFNMQEEDFLSIFFYILQKLEK